MTEQNKSGRTILNVAALVGLIALLVAWLLGDRLLLELEFFYKSRVASELSATSLKVEAVPGLRMFLQPDDTTITPVTLGWGEWEPTETYWIGRMLEPGDTFVDVGANVGYFTLLAGSIVGDEGHVYSFEPDPIAFSYLEKNVRLNGLENVTLVQKAASNERGTLQLFIAAENKGDHRIYQTEEGRSAIDVEAISLDEYFADAMGSLDVVKIDTQGAEGVILDGMTKTLAAHPDLIIALEFWPAAFARMGYEAEAIVEMLRANDFYFFDMGPGPDWLPSLNSLSDRDVLEGLTLENNLFTNLLMVKGYVEHQRLDKELVDSRQRLLEDTPEFDAAQAQWEEEIRTAAGGAAAPAHIAAAVNVAPESRSEEQARAVKNYFRSTSKLFVRQRRDLTQARARLAALQARLLERE